MRFIIRYTITFVFILACSISCKKEIEKQNTDISVTANTSFIYWGDALELQNEINKAFTFNYGVANFDEIETSVVINSDTSLVKASITVKSEFQHKYNDQNPGNNQAEIKLYNENVVTQYDPNEDNDLRLFTYRKINQSLEENLDAFNLSTEDFIEIPLTFHIIRTSNGNSSFEIKEILNQIEKLNATFYAAKITFTQCGSINYIDDNNFYLHTKYDLEDDFIASKEDVPNTINIYLVRAISNVEPFDPDSTISGYAYFPYEDLDRIYISYNTFLTSTLEHEMGHIFSLYHTFSEAAKYGVSGSECNRTGDGICATPIDKEENISDCENNEVDKIIVRNFMSYSPPSCRMEFVPEQLRRMAFSARYHRNYLHCNGYSSISNIALSGNLHFGNVQINTNSNPKTLTVSNIGTAAFGVTDILLPNGFSVSNGSSQVIQPGESWDYYIVFSPTYSQTYNGNITVENNADIGTNTIEVSGVGVNNTSSIISLSGNLNFGDVEIGNNSSATLTISNTGSKNLSVSSINLPSTAYTSNWNFGTITAGSSQNVIITFTPTYEQNYNGNLTVNSDADNGDNSISVSGRGVKNNTGQPNLIYSDYSFQDDDNGNGVLEAGESIELDIQLQNIGTGSATNVDVIITTSDPDITITDRDRTYNDIGSGTTNWNTGGFNFDIDSECNTKDVQFNLQINSNEGIWYDSFTVNVQGQNNSLPEVYAVHSPRDNCSSTGSSDNYRLDLNTIYYRNNWNIDNILSYGSDNKRGMWYRFRTSDSGLYHINLTMNGDPGFQLYYSCVSNAFETIDVPSQNSEGFSMYFSSNTDVYIRFYDNYDNSNVDFEISVEH